MERFTYYAKRFLATLGLIVLGIAILAITAGIVWVLGCLLKTIGELLKGGMEWTFNWVLSNWGVIVVIVLLIAAVGYVVGDSLRKSISERRKARKMAKGS